MLLQILSVLHRDRAQAHTRFYFHNRGHKAFNHPGNQHFRLLIESHIHEYEKAVTKLDKSAIVSKIVEGIRRSSPEGGFVKMEAGRWYEVGDHNAREKTGQK